MKKLFLPLVVDKDTYVENHSGGSFIPGVDPWQAYTEREAAVDAAKKLSVQNPKAKVVVLVSDCIIEPRRIEFAEKTFNASGELVV